MKRHSSAARLTLAVLVAVGLAGPAMAGAQVPFKGSLEGNVTVSVVPPSLKVDVEALGEATQLGHFTLDIPHLVNPSNGTADGLYKFTVANGDTLTATFKGVAIAIAPGVLYIEETATIKEGTGRFAGCTGSFTIERLYDIVAAKTSGSFAGTISAPGP